MKKMMLGNEAIARGAYEAGVTVVASYPGTPSTEITENIVKYDEIYAEWAPNEKVAAEVAIGASIAGARAMSCMKHVGMNVMADPMFTVSYTGVNGGLVFCVADDPGMHSSQNEQDSRHYAKAAKIMMLEPSDSSECKEFVKLAFELSEKFDTPVIIRLTTRVAHSQSEVELCEREDYELKKYEKNALKYAMVPANAIKRHVIVEQRMKDIAQYADNCEINKAEMNSSEIGVITSGISYMYAKEALGDSVSYLKLGMVYPFCDESIKEFTAKVKKVYILEELDPFIEEHCRALGLDVIGKSEFSLLGEYSAGVIGKVILGKELPESMSTGGDIPVRPPVLCPGCPHRGVFYVLKKLGLTVSGDIGCYALGGAAPLSSIDTTICMGASVSGSLGMEKARGMEFGKKLVSVIGDSTFIHSGMTGLTDIVYNKGNCTVIILDNAITGMTGHQNNPTTGFTIRGEVTRRVDIEALCRAVGVEHVTVVDPFDLKETERVIKEETQREAPSVIIARRPCALLKYVKYSGHCGISDKCRKCRVCLKIGCPAISLGKDGTVKINEALCNGCTLCVNVCPFGAIEKKD